MFNRAELKQQSRDQLRGRWGGAVGAFLLVFLVEAAIAGGTFFIPYGGGIISLVISGPIMVGLIIYCMNLVNTYEKVDVAVAFKGFSIFGPSLATYLWMVLWIYLWMFLFIIPGIVKAYAYSQSLYIIAENPNIGAREALKISMRMTRGYKFDIFVMQLSFIGWGLLCILSLNIGWLWLMPYMQLTLTNMYYKLKELSLESGACTPADFGMR